ncbi:alpha/beta hydrolase-fold protein [Pedobacter frigiditerrae]|uniref:alpha/beta hydrolase-fold protein n=1 Tax=Pedobacter frigiditerrae TaxID=2530452 RepID=UPI00292EA692|nr:alpha/beta hydrolase-fold protein [Pedobacter frigiditerrae]
MKRFSLFLVLLFAFVASVAQVKIKFELQNIPKSKDSIPEYFLAGSFNNWKPNDADFKFLKKAEGNYFLEKQFPAGRYEYKITRGNWTKVESAAKGNAVGNRSLKLQNDTTVKVTVLNWSDEFKKQLPNHTSSVNVKLLDSVFPMPQLGTTRRVWIYFPPSYAQSKKKYPVIYMHDGQNLFDEFTGGYGEWRIDEIMDKISAAGGKEFIVVGIDHGGSERLKEYNPYDSQYGKGKGKLYVDFLVNNLKPFIDKNYKTLKDVNNTSIAGSSMGGLISMYALATYPKIFGKAGVFSPAFWLAKPIEEDLKKALPNLKDSKIYFVAGTSEGKAMIRDMNTVYQILNPNGENKNIKLIEKADGEHKEWFWNREFTDFYKFIAN